MATASRSSCEVIQQLIQPVFPHNAADTVYPCTYSTCSSHNGTALYETWSDESGCVLLYSLHMYYIN